MKNRINNLLDWFENRFNYIIDITALIGSIITILLSIIITVLFIIGEIDMMDPLGMIMIPGFLGFLAIMMLFALRVTRHITRVKDEKE